jgi:hypothetical protein
MTAFPSSWIGFNRTKDGTFSDVAEKAGVALGAWSTRPTWGDYDRDGLLDLFVPGYVQCDPDHPPIAGRGGMPAGACTFRGIGVMCGPRGLAGEADHLFHNNGNGTFTDVILRAKVSDPSGYYGFASVLRLEFRPTRAFWAGIINHNRQIGSLLAKWLEGRIRDSSGGLRSHGHRGKRC